MFGDVGWAELMLIGVVALIVIGPEDLPDMFRQIGRFTAKLRQMSREFSRAMEQAAKESGVKDVAEDLKAVTSAKSLGLNKVKEAADRFEKWDPMKSAVKPAVGSTLVPPAMPASPAPLSATIAAAAQPAVQAPAPAGPETQALIDRQAAKKAILAETSAKLKAVEAGIPAAATAAAKSRAKPRAAASGAQSAPKPRAARTPKADKT